MDNQYRIVRSVQPGGGMASSDMHEFKLINNGKSALMTVYQQRQFDMSPWNVRQGVGWVMESVFQEIDVETGKMLFEWRSLDHVDPSLSYTYPDHTDTSGTGLSPFAPWDYFHINSIDKNADGDYLISSRHTCAIYKISGKDGSIIWQLHGQNPSFTNINFSFSQQHDARWLSENATHTYLSLYNNGYNGFNQTHQYSSGMLILIDHVDMTATQLRDYMPPGKSMLSSSQGNMQVLNNSHVFMGWGNNAYVSEHDADGNLVFWGFLSQDPGFMNYRAQKFEWDANPTDVPALWSYSRSTEPYSPTTLYVSWNGATRVKFWRFYGSMNATGPYTLLDELPKAGFETAYTDMNFYPWTHAEAVDGQGKLLGKSPNTFTFTPSPELQSYCSEQDCGNALGYGFPDDTNTRPLIPPMGVNTVPWVDPDNPEKLFDWGVSGGQPEETSSADAASGSVYGMLCLPSSRSLRLLGLRLTFADYTNWAVGAVVVLIAAVAVQLIVSCCRRPRRRDQTYQDRRGSMDTLDDMPEGEPKPSETGERRRWWDWRTEDDYLPLQERERRGR